MNPSPDEDAAQHVLREHARTPRPYAATTAALIVATAARRRGDRPRETSALLLAATAAADCGAADQLHRIVQRLVALHGPHAAAALPERVQEAVEASRSGM